jgi:hypothetical protein
MISMSYLENSIKSCPRAQLLPDKRGRTVADCRGRSGRAIGLIFRSTAALREGARKLGHRLAAVIVAEGVNRDGRREVVPGWFPKAVDQCRRPLSLRYLPTS